MFRAILSASMRVRRLFVIIDIGDLLAVRVRHPEAILVAFDDPWSGEAPHLGHETKNRGQTIRASTLFLSCSNPLGRA